MGNTTENRMYAELLGEILSGYVGHGKEQSVADFAAKAEISENIVYGLLGNSYTPSFAAAMRVVAALPEPGAARFWEALGFTGLRRIDGPRTSYSEAACILAEGSLAMMRLLADGKDHRTKAEWHRHHRPRLSAALASMET